MQVLKHLPQYPAVVVSEEIASVILFCSLGLTLSAWIMLLIQHPVGEWP